MANEPVLQPCTNIVPAVLHVPMESSSQSVVVPKDSITMLHPCAKVDMHMGAIISASTVHMRLPVTPKYKSSSSLTCSSFIPECQESLKPVVGMSFDSVDDVEKFYKSYAHESGFSVRIGQHKKENEEILIKRYYCSREGYRDEKDTRVIDQSKKKRKTHNVMETRCGCEAHIVVKLGTDKKYRISSIVEEHNHGLVSPNKKHLLRSNRRVNQRVKSTLFNCHKASIGTSQAYRLLHVSEGGFQNVGCTLRDLQNYYRDLRTKIKDADAQMFVAQLERKKEVNSAFFYDFEVDEQGRLMHVFWADATSRKNYKLFGDVVSLDSTYTTNLFIFRKQSLLQVTSPMTNC